MGQKFDPDFVGNGKIHIRQGRHGEFKKMEFTVFRDSIIHLLKCLGTDVDNIPPSQYGSLTIEVGEKPNVSPKGFTHYMKVNHWRPENQDQTEGQPPVEDVSQDPADYVDESGEGHSIADEEEHMPF